MRKFSWKEIQQHKSSSSCWIVIEGSVYDVTEFLSKHPGGNAVLLTRGGADCTLAFDDVGHPAYAEERREQYKIGTVEQEGATSEHLAAPVVRMSRATLASVLVDASLVSPRSHRVLLPHDAEYAARVPHRRRFAAAVSGCLTRRECLAMIRVAEEAGFEAAQFGAVDKYDLRRSSKCVLKEQHAADLLFARVRAVLPQEFRDEGGRLWRLSRMHPRLKFLRYGPGEFFAPHRDGGQMGPGEQGTVEKSFVTVMVYLSDSARAGFMAEDFDCVGGGLGFLSTSDARYPSSQGAAPPPVDSRCPPIGAQRNTVEPEAGLFVAFEHGILHEGEPLLEGTKYGIRTDVMYSSTGDDIPELIKRVAPDGFVEHALSPESYMDFGAAGGAATHEEALRAWLKRSAPSSDHLQGPTSDAEFAAGERLFAINPKYLDGTRLRESAQADSVFNGAVVLNDTRVTVKQLSGGFALVESEGGASGWIRLRNLTRVQRVLGLPRVLAVKDTQLTAIDYYSKEPISLTGIKKPCHLEDIVAVVTGAARREVNGLYVIFKKEGQIKTYANRLMWWSAPSDLDTAFQLFCDGDKWWIGHGLYRWDTGAALPPASGWSTSDKQPAEDVALRYTCDEEDTGEITSITVSCAEEAACGVYYRAGRENGHDRYEKRDGWFICSTGHHWWVSFDLYVNGVDPLTGEPPTSNWSSYPTGMHDPAPSILLCSRIHDEK